MTIQTRQEGGFNLHHHNLSNPLVSLDPTSPPWTLRDGEASDILGLDVIHRNHFRPERGRKPIGVSLSDGPFSCVIPLDVDAVVPERRDYIVHSQLLKVQGTGGSYDPVTGIFSDTELAAFSNNFRTDDFLYVFSADTLQGIHKILSASSTTVTIASNLTTVGVSTNNFFIAHGRNLIVTEDMTVNGITYNVVTKSKELYNLEGPWSTDLIDTTLTVDEDSRAAVAPVSQTTIKDIGTYGQLNDSLLLPASFTGLDSASDNKITTLTATRIDKRGFLVSNGEKFWLLKGGIYTLVLDLNDATLKGTVWRGHRIASNRMLLVADGQIPRVFHFNRLSPIADNEAFAGCILPVKPNEEIVEDDNVFNASWGMGTSAGKGSLTDSTGSHGIRTRIRGVNLIDGLASEFVQVTSSSSIGTVPPSFLNDIDLATTLNDGVSVVAATNGGDVLDPESGFTPPIHDRITHIEVWRTTVAAEGGTYLESRMLIANRDGNEPETTQVTHRSWFNATPAGQYPIRLADENIIGQPILTNTEFESGGLPPVCRDVVSLNDVTFCFGKSNAGKVTATLYARNFFATDGTYVTSTGVFTFSVASLLSHYMWQSGDELVVTHGGGNPTDGEMPEGIYPIINRVSSTSVTISQDITARDMTTTAAIHSYIRRPFKIQWPVIEDDEEVWYSRTDKFGPENFPPRVHILSRKGDIFRRAIILADYIVVVMAQAVHLLFLDGITLRKDTVEESSSGTPWPDSVVKFGDQIWWATKRGLNVLTTTPNVDQTGRRGRITQPFGLRFASWFQAAIDNNEPVDAGVDLDNHAIRFRRQIATDEYQVLQIKLPEGQNSPLRVTFLDDDSGFRYEPSYTAESTERSVPPLYSIEKNTGAVFEVNSETFDPYPTSIVEGTTTKETYNVTTTSIESTIGGIAFSSKMVGDVIRIKDTTGTEFVRTIRTATSNQITFLSIPGLSVGASFIIAARRFRVRFAPFRGQRSISVINLHEMTLRLLPGASANPPGVTVRAFRNFDSTPAATAQEAVFQDVEIGRTTEDRVLSIHTDGVALEVEIESFNARNDFQIETIEVVVREERSTNASE